MVAGRRVPTPVSVTMPMMMPTQAAAATSGTTPRAAVTRLRIVKRQSRRVALCRLLTATITTSDSVTARNAV